jgi:OTU domain-containing protein 6
MVDDDLDTVLTRHKREQKALTSQITSLKKTVTKGEKSKRKEVLAEVDRLERELKDRHQRELDEINGRREIPVDVENAHSSGENLTTADPVGLEKLKLGDPPSNEAKSSKPKVNRQKARMV